LQFQILGQLGVRAEAGDIELGSPKQRSVLAVLLLHANEVVPTDRIIDLVWGENPPRTAEHSVQIYISELRKALANGSSADLIDTRAPGYVINVPPENVDTLKFERLVRDGLAAVRADDPARGRAKLEEALDTWTGQPLADFAYEDFAQGYIRSLTELKSDALEALAGLELEQGDLEAARERASRAIDADPLREGPHRVMMLALYRSGRQAEALRHYTAYNELLTDELGIEPTESLRQLEEQILLQDHALHVRPSTGTEGNPYRGLRAFSEDDADVYFGRESLVAEVLDRLANGPGFVSIVGPSGSGKSSAARAGVTPELRFGGDTVVIFQPGSRPLWELAGALDRAGFGTRASLLRRLQSDPGALSESVTRPVVLIIDQFEELFTLGEPDVAFRFGELISSAIRDHSVPLRVVATLRADYYDKPLSIPALAGVFSDSVVSVKPMTPPEIERAVVEPARAAGVDVEPALVAQLIADMGDEPGALPLLQFTLFEMFGQSRDGLTLDDYRSLGGINGALTGGADQLLAELDQEGKMLAEQLMMRMIQKGRALSTSKPVLLRDLLDLGVDSVDLQGVLEAFGSRRLVTFDRDASGAAVVEMAHEYLISKWPQMELWLDDHGEDLDALHALDAATEEWLVADRSPDYLLRGARLERFLEWQATTTLRLTRSESAFITASRELRVSEERDAAEQADKERSLRRSARRRLWAFGAAVAAFATAVTLLVVTLTPEPPPDVVVWYGGRGDGSFGDLIASGIDAAREANRDLVIEERTEVSQQNGVIRTLVGDGVPLVLWEGSKLGGWDVFSLIEEHPETHFVYIDCTPDDLEWMVDVSNASCILAANEEMGFLAGVAAASVTGLGRVGFLGGLDLPVVQHFQAGFEQGVAFVDDAVEVDVVYLTTGGDLSGFGSWTMGSAATEHLVSRGSDVIFHASGGSGWGMFLWLTEERPDLWGIGVDVDQYLEIEGVGWADETVIEAVRALMLTSVIKRLDSGIAAAIGQMAESGEVDDVFLSIANDGVQYTTSGGHITPWAPRLDAAIESVKSGSMTIDRDDRSDPVYLLDELLP
jgi:DNA-binding SARP family transcriptional activator/basic membrane lipoprotein Med (substrate-binding protein (PBP1-ABC) superfamily)